MEEKGEVSDQEICVLDKEPDQQLSEEQNYREPTGMSSRSWVLTRYWNLKGQPLLKMITPLPVPGPSQPAKY